MIPSYKKSDYYLVPNGVNYNLPYGKPISEYEYRDSKSQKKLFSDSHERYLDSNVNY